MADTPMDKKLLPALLELVQCERPCRVNLHAGETLMQSCRVCGSSFTEYVTSEAHKRQALMQSYKHYTDRTSPHAVRILSKCDQPEERVPLDSCWCINIDDCFDSSEVHTSCHAILCALSLTSLPLLACLQLPLPCQLLGRLK